MFYDNLFKNRKLNEKKAINAGFIKNGKVYTKNYKICNNSFNLNINIEYPNHIKTILSEIDTQDIYTLHLTNAEGTFVGKVREEYIEIMRKIADEILEFDIFKCDYTHKVIEYIRQKYGDELEYLWDKFPENAVARRKDNKKWYLAILTVSKDKLGFETKENAEIIDLRAEKNEVPNLVKQNNIFTGYHMNKKSWISIILDGSMNINEIYKMIDKSYILAGKTK